MRRGGRILILLGILLGMLAAGGTFIVLSTQQAPAPPVETRAIVIAVQNILSRTEIPVAALGKAEYPVNNIPQGAFERIEDVSGKLALTPIVPGQIILPQMIIDKTRAGSSRSNASFLIPEGKVAVAFPSNALASVSGAIQTGDYVDIMLTLSPGGIQGPGGRTTTGTTGTEGQPVTQLMLQDVLILQMGLWSAAGSTGSQQQAAPGDMITFVLSRQDALALKSAREQGTIEFALRRSGDHAPATTEPVNLEYLNRRFNFRLTPGR